ncbi:MAG: metalloregulator ArsR/SmtB family transcription factor [Ignavibacteria bacterium]
MYKEKNTLICGITLIDEKKVNFVKKKIPENELISQISETFCNLSDFTRVKILFALTNAELCVCDIAALMDVSVSAISHQLRLLRHSKLVKFRKEGKMVYYSLDDNHIKSILKNILKHFNELKK